jgi:hypothetical protein
MTNDEFIISLTEKFAFLRPILEEHLVDNGELLPHIFMGYLTQIISNKILDKISDANIERSVIPVLYFLDRSFSYGSAEIKELISVSFLENLSIGNCSAPFGWGLAAVN